MKFLALPVVLAAMHSVAMHNPRDTLAIDNLVSALGNATAQAPACITTVSSLNNPSINDPAYVDGMTANCFPLTGNFIAVDTAAQGITASDYSALSGIEGPLTEVVTALTTLRTSDMTGEAAFQTGGAPCESVAVCRDLVSMYNSVARALTSLSSVLRRARALPDMIPTLDEYAAALTMAAAKGWGNATTNSTGPVSPTGTGGVIPTELPHIAGAAAFIPQMVSVVLGVTGVIFVL